MPFKDFRILSLEKREKLTTGFFGESVSTLVLSITFHSIKWCFVIIMFRANFIHTPTPEKSGGRFFEHLFAMNEVFQIFLNYVEFDCYVMKLTEVRDNCPRVMSRSSFNEIGS